ncbi:MULTISPECIES: helix-turn-helix domain-containing protein [Lactobacillaceae]|uniref:helix-turn-helix domain-containing protein n=1 Tax=Lactobacillaceae TaxID=33958 RepID=UPI0014576461|nr:helix-turn-helix transcriptional regulator [Lactobacillus sp. HBUAS51381]NLR09868.1 helix-turn-helix transcriptional regulator [Lactobacillus sp. HBUAS51381]
MAITTTDFATAVLRLGRYLQARRQALNLSQAALAAGICAQTQINRIEQGQQVPDATLLTRLCTRLHLPLGQLLKENYPIRRLPTVSRKIHRLSDHQQYGALMTYLDQPQHLQALNTDEDLKTYYYYYGYATYQATHDSATALQRIRTALTMMLPQRPRRYRTLELLLLAVENEIQVTTTQQADFRGFERVVQIIREERLIDPQDNVCAIFYQYARACLHLGQPERALPILLEGIDWAVAHRSHYLLADDYYLLVQIYAGLSQRPHVRPSKLLT